MVPERLQVLRETHAAARAQIERGESDGGPTLLALLFRPVQRMCLYPLLLREALKHISEDSELYELFNTSFNSVNVTIAQVNDRVRDAVEQRKTAGECGVHPSTRRHTHSVECDDASAIWSPWRRSSR